MCPCLPWFFRFRVVICPLLYAPKFCDQRLKSDENYLEKIISINEWIKDFNRKTTNLSIDLDSQGVHRIPKLNEEGVQHDYDDWNEPQWNRMLHLNPTAKSIVAQEVIDVFTKLDSMD